jgi:hypothetical protein
MNRDINEFVVKYMEYQYELGSAKTRANLKTDCLRMLIDYMEFKRIEIPATFGDYTIDNYESKYIDDAHATSKALCDFIRFYFVARPSEERKYGDIVLLDNQDCKTWGIFMGNGSVMIIDTTAVHVVVEELTFTMTGCFECQQRSQ